MWAEVRDIYRTSKKKQDINWFTEHVARPPAAVVVYAIKGTRITPNQVTFLSAAIAAGACALFAVWPGWAGAIVAALVLEFSFVLDCADGQLARLRKAASPVGHLLDFLMDELKAMLLFGCVSVRLWQEMHDERLLVVGVAGLFCLASGIALTSFMRRPEYGAKGPTEDGQPAQLGKGPLAIIEYAARIVVHYPQYIWICAFVNRLDVFFWGYAVVNALYLAKSLLSIFLKLGRFA